MIWELVFMLVILKIPVVYLIAVVWWAIKATPEPPRATSAVPALDPELGPRCSWTVRRLSRRPGRGPRPSRRVARRGAVALARAPRSVSGGMST
jgi:hypothetical protein